MKFMEYVRRSEGLRHETARTRPAHFLLIEFGRYAAVMALVLVITDVTPWSFRQEDPIDRVWFVVAWAGLMAGVSMMRLRSRKPLMIDD